MELKCFDIVFYHEIGIEVVCFVGSAHYTPSAG